MKGDKLLESIQRNRPEKATQNYLREMTGFRDYAHQLLEEGAVPRLPARGSDPQTRGNRYGITDEPMTPENRQLWQRVHDAAQAEVDWATEALPAHKRPKKR